MKPRCELTEPQRGPMKPRRGLIFLEHFTSKEEISEGGIIRDTTSGLQVEIEHVNGPRKARNDSFMSALYIIVYLPSEGFFFLRMAMNVLEALGIACGFLAGRSLLN